MRKFLGMSAKRVTFASMNIDELKDKRVAVLLSGGVDSSVVVHELASRGLRPDCFYIRIGPEEKEAWDCNSEEDMEMSTAVAARYGCKLQVVDCHKEYWSEVTRYTMEKVKAGYTPNPDVMCNRLIKFGAFHEKMGWRYDLIATGHYAQTEWAGDKKWLTTSPDPVKDQTDFLAQIEGWQLRKAIFPIGHYEKGKVRQIAEREHLVNARRKDSQGICFLGNIDYNEYVRRYVGELEGDVIELETGSLVGRHKGHWFHTIGQRKGLGLGGGPWFVVKKDAARNILYVSHGYNPDSAYKKDFKIHDLHWLTETPKRDGRASLHVGDFERSELPEGYIPVSFKIRHTPEYHLGYLEMTSKSMALDGGESMIHSLDKIHGVAPGQFCVIYDERHHRCFGSAEITI